MVIKKWYKRWGAAERLSRESSERTGGDSGGGFARWLFPAPGRKGKRMSLKQVEKPVFTALGVALAAVAVVGVTRMALAEPPADATFKGRTLCLGCHSKLTTEITDAYAKTAHPKALQTPDQPGAVVATFDEDSPFKKEDIAYVLGVGKRQQAYVGKDGKLLPAEWDVQNKKWKPAQAADATAECVPCHTNGYDAAKKTWIDAGVSCESCHGPGSAHAASADKTKIGNPSKLPPAKQAMVCARCHSAGVTKDGAHKYPAGLKWGDDITTVFTLTDVKGPGRNQQYNEWMKSTHAGKDVTCVTCHEPHGKGATTEAQLVKPEKELCSGCHAAALQSATHPKLTDAMKCGLCHMPQGSHTFAVPGKG